MAITQKIFGTMPDGTTVDCYTLERHGGLSVNILTYGGCIQSLCVPTPDGSMTDIALGYNDLNSYLKGSGHLGMVVGRFANRIKNGRFTLGGKKIQMPANDGPNHLHGEMDTKVFEASAVGETLRLKRVSPDGEDGLPGNLSVEVRYSLSDPMTLKMELLAKTDKKTVVNLTNHSYWNLAGEGTIEDHILQINAPDYIEVTTGSIPTGRLVPTAGTAFDFSKPRPLGDALSQGDDQFAITGGIDHCLVFDDHEDEQTVATLTCPRNGLTMTLATSQPGVQLYTANYLGNNPVREGKGKPMIARGGVCLETQHYPDSPNHSSFPNVILNPGETYREVTYYHFEK